MAYISSISFIIIGTLIGAGFISGAEIKLFFYSFGSNGFIGLFFSSIFSGFIIFFTIQRQEKSYHEILKKSFNNPIPRTCINLVILFFLLISFFIMVAGFSSFLNEVIGINRLLGSVILCIISFFILKSGKNGVSKLNTFLVPFLLVIIFLCLFLYHSGTITYSLSLSGWFTSSLVYTSYNSILLIPILLEIKKDTASKKDNFFISIISSFILFVCGFIILFLLCQNSNSYFLEIPILGIIHSRNSFLSCIIKIGILLAMITTAISSEYAFIKEISSNNKKYLKNLFIISIVSVFISQIGFQSLVENLYPIFGVLGIINLFIIF